MITTIEDGGLVTKDPADIVVKAVDWDVYLRAGVAISTSTWTITAISPSTVDTALTKDEDAKLTAAEATTATGRAIVGDHRVTRIRLTAGTVGQVYEVANKVVTNESPTQTIERSFRVKVEQK